MADKKIYTREEFELFRKEQASLMAHDRKLSTEALEVLVQADHYSWIHQTNWFGEPILNLSQDMFALQEIIFKTRLWRSLLNSFMSIFIKIVRLVRP